MCDLTVITATFNRREKLRRAYDALCRQDADGRFIWLIIDDGSTDGTEEQVVQWQQENKVKIEYLRTENNGVTRARHIGRILVKTYWMTVMDSDDYYVDGALNEILGLLETTGIKNDEKCAGLLFPIVNAHTTDIVEGNYTLTQQYFKHKCVGDFQVVDKTDICRFAPPHFVGEKFVTESAYLRKMDFFFYYRCLNRRYMVRDYYEDGLTQNLGDVIQKNPQGQAYAMKIDAAFGRDMGFTRRVQAYIDFINFSKNRLNAASELFPEVNVPIIVKFSAFLLRRNKFLRFLKGMIQYPFPKKQIVKDEKIILWGAGNMGKAWKLFADYTKYCSVTLWCDINYMVKRGEGLDVCSPDKIEEIKNYDHILLAIQSPNESAAVKRILLEKGINEEKITRVVR